ncbi:MAG: hypothetical protein ACLVEX_15035 [Ruthenibacterium lactatiformans]
MEWTDIKTTVPAVWAETAEAIATGISGGGIYIEDYRDLEAQVEAIAHVDLIEQELLDKSRDEVAGCTCTLRRTRILRRSES